MKHNRLIRVLVLLFAAFLMLHISGCAKNPAPQNNADIKENEPIISSSPDKEVFEEN